MDLQHPDPDSVPVRDAATVMLLRDGPAGMEVCMLLRNLRSSAPVAVIGTPSLESQRYASETSRAGHVNCKSAPDFRAALRRYWRRVFLFSMNDEVIHTGFYPMAHYLIALATD